MHYCFERYCSKGQVVTQRHRVQLGKLLDQFLRRVVQLAGNVDVNFDNQVASRSIALRDTLAFHSQAFAAASSRWDRQRDGSLGGWHVDFRAQQRFG